MDCVSFEQELMLGIISKPGKSCASDENVHQLKDGRMPSHDIDKTGWRALTL